MATTVKIDLTNQDLLSGIRDFFQSILKQEEINTMLVPQHLPMQNSVMPVLISDPDKLDGADPLSPAFMMNSAKMVSRLSRKPAGMKTAVVLRPCEIRAFVELVKLKQARMDELVIIGVDCLGALSNRDFIRFAGDDLKTTSLRFCENILTGKGTGKEGFELTSACRACESPIPEGADIVIGLFGMDLKDQIMVQSRTAKGDELLKRLDFPKSEEPPGRKETIDNIVSERKSFRDKMFVETAEAVNDLDKLSAYLAGCVNCYNCRVACPVCYCKECVFMTDVFNHEPSQYQQWALRKGSLKMPTDTLFYHITRAAHISTACVGCGQCSNACPNDIRLMELFRTIAQRTQSAFGYEAGRSVDDPPPLSEFKEDEFEEVVGIG